MDSSLPPTNGSGEHRDVRVRLDQLEEEVFGGKRVPLRFELEAGNRSFGAVMRLLKNEQHIRRLQRADDEDFRGFVLERIRLGYALVLCSGALSAFALVGVGVLLYRSFNP